MRILKNRITLSLIAILALTYVWEFHVRPESSPLYTAAVSEYKDENYANTLELLERAYRIDPNNTAIITLFGWTYLKSGNHAEAQPYFTRALRLGPDLQEARLGLAYCWLESGDAMKALEHFLGLERSQQDSLEVRTAMARAYRILGDNQRTLQIALEVLEEDSQNVLARKELVYLTGIEDPETWKRIRSRPLVRPSKLAVTARLRNGYFEVQRGGRWQRIYVAGVNVGPATPGHFASEPVTDVAVYLDWLDKIGQMGANTVRVYTILPPAFYRALLAYNLRHPQDAIYLFQEIWLKDPPNENLWDKAFTDDFEREIRDAVDVVHGRSDLPIRVDHAGGVYTADLSPYVLGWLVGREIEPHVVITTNLRNPGAKEFAGRYLKISDGNASEVWLTERCDFLVDYEVKQYNRQTPVAFVSWPPLDPITHPTETPLRVELRIRRARGEILAPLGLGIPDDNDMTSLDEEKISAEPAFQAGYFALSHIYPFYPDFILLDPLYRRAKDRQGPNSYWGYLQDLKKHYRRTPLLVGEYGLSTSIGIAHFNDYGMNHGGLNEVEQGEALARLTENIQDAGFAGGIIFEWIDEWWKRNWITVDFEKPFFRSALWHNDMNPEQSFGLMKFIPENPLSYSTLDSSTFPDGPRPPPEGSLPIRSLRAASDPSAFYLDLELSSPPGSEPSWSENLYLIALNTCGEECGSSRLPVGENVEASFGANFVVVLSGPEDGRLWVADSYNPYRQDIPIPGLPLITDVIVPRSFKTLFEPQAGFEELIVQTNRRRYGRNGVFFPGQKYSRSLLRYGAFDSQAEGYDSLGQWYFDRATNRIRMRLSWGLLLVLDPSQGLVFDGTDEEGEIAGKVADRIQLGVVAYAKKGAGSEWNPVQIMAPSVRGTKILEGWSIPWPRWSTVRFKSSLKQSYWIVAKAFRKLSGDSKPQ